MRNLIYIIILLAILTSCGGKGLNETYGRIDRMCDGDPRTAMQMLDSIDYANLSEHDRHCHDLLTIKASDKAYITHTSDSLILDVIEYFSGYGNKILYPEALYYGGRVYADMRNYQQAMKHYQLAINKLAETKSNIKLRRAILSQSALILNKVGLDSMALSYMKEVITISEQLNDSIAIAYDNILAAELHLNCKNTVYSRKHIIEANRYSKFMTENDRSWLHVSFAALLQMENKPDSALIIIRPCIQKVDSTCLNYTLANAAEIYLAAGYTDSAYMFARKLLSNSRDDNHMTGYSIVLSDEMGQAFSTDTLKTILDRYRYLLTKCNDNNEAASMIIQQNYTIHDDSLDLRCLWFFIMGTLIIITTLVLIIRIKRRNNHLLSHSVKIDNHDSIENHIIAATTDMGEKSNMEETSQITEEHQEFEIAEINEDDDNQNDNQTVSDKDNDIDINLILKSDNNIDNCISNDIENIIPIIDTDQLPDTLKTNNKRGKEIRLYKERVYKKKGELMAELMTRVNSKGDMVLSAAITNSSVYIEIQECLSTQRSILNNKRIWRELQEIILSDSPEFMDNLRTLVLPKCTNANIETAFLIRIGIRPFEMAILLNLTKSSVSDRRTRLGNLIFEGTYDFDLLERIIFSL